MRNRRNIITATVSASLPVFMGVAFAVSAMTAQAPTGGFVFDGADDAEQYVATSAAKPENVPSWDKSDAATGCQAEQVLSADVLVVTLSGDRVVMDFDTAWNAAQDENGANDVWVVGYCG